MAKNVVGDKRGSQQGHERLCVDGFGEITIPVRRVMLESLTLTEQAGKTILFATSTLESGSPEAVEAMLQSGMAEGAAKTYDRLEAYAHTLA